MLPKSVPGQTTTATLDRRPRRDVVRWIIWGSIGLAAAAGLSGVAFLAGYLTALHAVAATIRTDHAIIARLNQQLQTAHTQLAHRTTSRPPAHGSWWLWWLGLPFRHIA